jgi:hypothetical protein
LLPGAGWLLFTWVGPAYASGLAIFSACCGIGLGWHFLRLYYQKRKRSGQPDDVEWRRIEKERYLLAKEAILEGARQRSAIGRQRVIQ